MIGDLFVDFYLFLLMFIGIATVIIVIVMLRLRIMDCDFDIFIEIFKILGKFLICIKNKIFKQRLDKQTKIERKIKRKYKKELKHYLKNKCLDINILRYEYSIYIKIVDDIAKRVLKKNDNIKTNDMYLYVLDQYIRGTDSSLNSLDGIVCLYRSIEKFPIIYTVDAYTKLKNIQVLSKLSSNMFNQDKINEYFN